jgi:hypothetical protein
MWVHFECDKLKIAEMTTTCVTVDNIPTKKKIAVTDSERTRREPGAK